MKITLENDNGGELVLKHWDARKLKLAKQCGYTKVEMAGHGYQSIDEAIESAERIEAYNARNIGSPSDLKRKV